MKADVKNQKTKLSKTRKDQPYKRDDSSRYNLRDHFLISMPSLEDSYFSRSLMYICDHSEQGALGIVLNSPLSLNVGDLFKQLNIPYEKSSENQTTEQDDSSLISECPILAGGPVNTERGFILHTAEQEWESTIQVSSSISLTASKDILFALAENKGPKKSLIALGYAGWNAGQLEAEIAENSWLTVPANSEIIFDTPYERRWAAASKYFGIDIHRIHPVAGHA